MAPSADESELLLQLILDASPDIGNEPSPIQESVDGVEALIHPADLARVRVHYACKKPARRRSCHRRMPDRPINGSYRQLRFRQKALSPTADGALKPVLGMAADITNQQEAKSELNDLRRPLSSTHDEERRRVALEMHDTVMQHLVGAALLLNSLEKVVSIDSSINGTIERAQASQSKALSDVVAPPVA